MSGVETPLATEWCLAGLTSDGPILEGSTNGSIEEGRETKEVPSSEAWYIPPSMKITPMGDTPRKTMTPLTGDTGVPGESCQTGVPPS